MDNHEVTEVKEEETLLAPPRTYSLGFTWTNSKRSC